MLCVRRTRSGSILAFHTEETSAPDLHIGSLCKKDWQTEFKVISQEYKCGDACRENRHAVEPPNFEQYFHGSRFPGSTCMCKEMPTTICGTDEMFLFHPSCICISHLFARVEYIYIFQVGTHSDCLPIKLHHSKSEAQTIS